ncbi:MAG: helix-turn-helix transcriptional regulator [Candidatus Kurthia intestinigallinarum]
MDTNQITRVLSIYSRFYAGEGLNKRAIAAEFQVSEKTIQRDFNQIRDFLEQQGIQAPIRYNASEKKYFWHERNSLLKPDVIYSTTKILLESRAFLKNEMQQIIEHLIGQVNLDQRKILQNVLSSDMSGYRNLQTNISVTNLLWQLAKEIEEKNCIRIVYTKEFNPSKKPTVLFPVGIIFSEYYFYLIAYQTSFKPDYPTIYRIDRIQSLESQPHFKPSYNIAYFSESAFRDRIQFMYTGALMTIRFRFTGPSVQAVLDRIPTARQLHNNEFEAEVYGKGIKMWLLSQGPHIEVLSPASFRAEMKEEIQHMLSKYD